MTRTDPTVAQPRTARRAGPSRVDRTTGRPGAAASGDAGQVVIVGAGPAGLTAAFTLLRDHGIAPTVLEAGDDVGGLSRTVERDGWRFDIGGHRFFTKVGAVEALWRELLDEDDFLLRPRKSRISYRGRYFDYPLDARNALRNLGPIEALRCVASYLRSRLVPPRDQTNYEGWLVARFGWRLYRTFFKAYTEKLWGLPVDEMPSDWAAQRVKGLSLGTALLDVVRPRRGSRQVTSLIDQFHYPRLGPGMMWRACRDRVVAAGGSVELATPVRALRHSGGRVRAVVSESPDGSERTDPCDAVISSMPITDLVEAMDPPAPEAVRRAARSLRYRDFYTVALVVPAEQVTWDDNWIYLHDGTVGAMRIQNFGAWSPWMVRDGCNVLGLEYTCFASDPVWSAPDDELIERAKRELELLGLARHEDLGPGYVVRQARAYPIYDHGYREHLGVIRDWLEAHASNLHPVGRNGMFRYNNQDHSMLTAMLAVQNVVSGAGHDLWAVNVDDEYLEEAPAGTVPAAPLGSERLGR